MNLHCFLVLIRQYAALARRYRKSYAPAIYQITKLRAEQLAREIGDPDLIEQALADMDKVVDREYGSADRDWATFEPEEQFFPPQPTN